MTPETLHNREVIVTLLDKLLESLEKEQRQQRTFTTTNALHHKLDCKINVLFWQCRADIPFNIKEQS